MSAEVGSAHISIFPVMTGFKGQVSKGAREAGAAGAKTFEGGFKGVGSRAGASIGSGLKSALSSSAGDLGASAMKALSREVSAASGALSKARLKQQDDAGKVRVAEAKLAEAVKKYGENSSQAIAAEERLASARRMHASSVDAVTAASARLRTAQESLSRAQAAVEQSVSRTNGGLTALTRGLRAGWNDSRVAIRGFSGVAGSIGGLLRAVSDISGLSRLGSLAKLGAQQVSKAFTSMATMVGGGLAKAWSSSSRWLSGVGSTVRGAFAPFTQYAAAAGTILASPFVKLGKGVASWMSPVTSQVQGLWSKVVATAGPAASSFVARFGSGMSGLASSAGTALSGLARTVASAASSIGSALGAGIKNAATAGVAVAAAAVGVAFTKGVGRLTAIDTAQAKLRGLGNDAETVTRIMGDASASVKGTSFGLGEAATVAASAVAAGIKPGEALQGHLKRISNNASAAGMSMEEMGSIFNKAATQANGVQNDVISQLADRGIPIYQALADQMGVTAGEVFKMASEGKVDFETFSAAAEKAAGTVADEMGKTVPGAAKNFMAGMGRIGANALQGLYGKVGPLIAAATSALGPIEERAEAFGEVLLRVVGPAMDWVTNLLTRLGEGASLADFGLGGLTALLGPLAGGFAALGAGGLAGLLTKIPILGGMLGGLTGPLAALGGPLGIVAAALAGFVLSGADAGALASSITGVIEQVVAALPGVVSQVVVFIPQLVQSLLSQVPALLAAGMEIVTALVQGLVTAIPVLAAGAVSLVTGLVSAVVANLPMIIEGAMQLVTALIGGIITALPLLIEGALQLVTGLLTGIVAALPLIIEGGIQLLMALITGIIGALPMILEAALQLVTGLLTAVIENLPMLIEAGIQLLLSLVTGLINALPQLITAAIELVLQLVAGLLQLLPQLIAAGIELVVSLIVGLVKAIPQIIKMLPQIISAIVDGLMGVDWLGLGKDIIQGIIDGFFAMVGAVGEAIGSVVGGILDFFPHSPAKKGPLGPVGWRRMRTSGAALMDQFSAGARDEAAGFGAALEQAANATARRAEWAVSRASTAPISPAESTSAGTRGEGRLVHVEQRIVTPDSRAAAIASAELLRGGVIWDEDNDE